MQYILEFFGRLHPAIVHLPIGILLLFSLLVWIRNRINISVEALNWILGVGAASALVSILTGLVLSSDGEYSSGRVNLHKWMGIATTAVSVICWYATRKSASKESILKFASASVLVLTIITGHVGNDLVRGSSYLTEPLAAMTAGASDTETVLDGNVEEALLYAEVIKPILKTKCYSCHGEQKQKGKLRLDLPEYIVKGGKHGEVITPGDASNSELIMRINLPEGDDDHMPPKEKNQLSEKEIAWLTVWIEHGADFNRKVKDVIAEEALASMNVNTEKPDDYSDIIVSAPDKALISQLISQGVAISPIADESELLQVNLVSVPDKADSLLKQVARFGDNVVSLKLGSTQLTDEGAQQLTEFPNLRRLTMDDTKITDAAIEPLTSIVNLQHINLNGTAVTAKGLEKLSALNNLHVLFLYHTAVTPQEATHLQTQLPKVRIELGGYTVPSLPTDTVVLKPKN